MNVSAVNNLLNRSMKKQLNDKYMINFKPRYSNFLKKFKKILSKYKKLCDKNTTDCDAILTCNPLAHYLKFCNKIGKFVKFLDVYIPNNEFRSSYPIDFIFAIIEICPENIDSLLDNNAFVTKLSNHGFERSIEYAANRGDYLCTVKIITSYIRTFIIPCENVTSNEVTPQNIDPILTPNMYRDSTQLYDMFLDIIYTCISPKCKLTHKRIDPSEGHLLIYQYILNIYANPTPNVDSNMVPTKTNLKLKSILIKCLMSCENVAMFDKICMDMCRYLNMNLDYCKTKNAGSIIDIVLEYRDTSLLQHLMRYHNMTDIDYYNACKITAKSDSDKNLEYILTLFSPTFAQLRELYRLAILENNIFTGITVQPRFAIYNILTTYTINQLKTNMLDSASSSGLEHIEVVIYGFTMLARYSACARLDYNIPEYMQCMCTFLNAINGKYLDEIIKITTMCIVVAMSYHIKQYQLKINFNVADKLCDPLRVIFNTQVSIHIDPADNSIGIPTDSDTSQNSIQNSTQNSTIFAIIVDRALIEIIRHISTDDGTTMIFKSDILYLLQNGTSSTVNWPLENTHFIEYCKNNKFVQYLINKKIPANKIPKLPEFCQYLSSANRQKPFIINKIHNLTYNNLPDVIANIIYLYMIY